MNIDDSGFKWNIFETLGAITLAVAVVATLAVVIVCPLSLPLLAVTASGAGSGIGQVVSNISNQQPVFQNVLGATLGGAVSGLSYIIPGPAPSLAGGSLNAFTNELENSYRECRDFNVNAALYETIYYSGINYLTRLVPGSAGKQFFRGIYQSTVADAIGYTLSDKEFKDIFVDSSTAYACEVRGN